MAARAIILPEKFDFKPPNLNDDNAFGPRARTPFNRLGLKYLDRRAVIPAILSEADKKSKPNAPNTDNIQGDIYYMFPKKFERFVFFIIKDVTQFWKDLKTYQPRITSSAATAKRITKISEDNTGTVSFISGQIAFSKAGLMYLEIKDNLGDRHFDKGSMRKEKDVLGDKATWDDVFDNATTHGVLVITAKTDADCQTEEDAVRKIFTASISSFTSMSGRVRSGDGEHFGWRDGISQPGIKDLIVKPQKGQRIVKPGVIITGYEGDPVKDDPSLPQRPAFSKDGSFMIFRKLEQDVLGFEDYINRNWKAIPDKYGNGGKLNEKQRKALFGARMVGRFKTGAPLALTPYKDDSTYTDPDVINNFDYTEGLDVDNPDGPPNCPFAAHIRKTVPRKLDPLIQKEYLDASMIIRAGIPYGPEVSKDERSKWQRGDPQSVERGLLFVCYQSSIENGFFRQTTDFAGNDFFPINKVTPTVHGQDPIIGGPPHPPSVSDPVDPLAEGPVILNMMDKNSSKYVVTGVAQKVSTSATAYTPEYWVTSRGGEYFFVPSISAVKGWCDSPPSTSS